MALEAGAVEEDEEEEGRPGKDVADWIRIGGDDEEEEVELEELERLDIRATASAAAASAAAASATPRETLSASLMSRGANFRVRATPCACRFF